MIPRLILKRKIRRTFLPVEQFIKIVDIRFVRVGKRGHKVAGYMAKYMSKESAGRYSWSWGWVWRGFCRPWSLYKRYWWQHFNVEGKATFHNCLVGWQLWLKGVYIIDVNCMEADLPPSLVIKINRGQINPIC